MIPLWVFAAYAVIMPYGFYDILDYKTGGKLSELMALSATFWVAVPLRGLFFIISIADWLILEFLDTMLLWAELSKFGGL